MPFPFLECKESIKSLNKCAKWLLIVSEKICRISGYEELEQSLAVIYEEVNSEKKSMEEALDIFSKCVQCYKDTEKKLTSSETFDWHMLLDIGGLVPGVGMVCAGINAGWYAAEGDWGNALFSGMSFIPVIGEISGAGKVGVKAVTHADDMVDIVKTADKITDTAQAAGDAADVSKYMDDVIKGGLDTIIKNGKVSIDDIKNNPSAFSGKSAEEIADVLRNSGYDVTIKNSTRSRSGAQIIQVNNPGGGKNISQVQVSPGGGRHGSNPYVKISTTDQGIIKIVDGIESTYKTDGKETATIIFSGGN